MGYQAKFKGVVDFKKSKLATRSQFIFHYIICCLSGRTRGTDAMGKQFWTSYGVSAPANQLTTTPFSAMI